jgi:hypothetical protein
MRFKHGNAIVTAKKTKDGAVITGLTFKIGDHTFTASSLGYSTEVDKFYEKLERKAEKIFAKNAQNKKQHGGRKNG